MKTSWRHFNCLFSFKTKPAVGYVGRRKYTLYVCEPDANLKKKQQAKKKKKKGLHTTTHLVFTLIRSVQCTNIHTVELEINTLVMVHVRLTRFSPAFILYMCVCETPSPPTTHTYTLSISITVDYTVCGVWWWS